MEDKTGDDTETHDIEEESKKILNGRLDSQTVEVGVDFDTAIKAAGGFGRYQVLVFTFLSITGLTVAFHNLVHVFTGELPPHSCDLTVGPGIQTLKADYEHFIINNTTGTTHNHSDYNYNHSMFYPSGRLKKKIYRISTCGVLSNASFVVWSNSTDNKTIENDSYITCNKWKFDQSVYTSTVGTEV